MYPVYNGSSSCSNTLPCWHSFKVSALYKVSSSFDPPGSYCMHPVYNDSSSRSNTLPCWHSF